MTARTLPRARGSLAVGAVTLVLALSACSSGGTEAKAAASSPSSTSASAKASASETTETTETAATPAQEPAQDGQRLVAGGLSVLQPDGWQGGRTDAASVDATLASLDPRVGQLLGPQLKAAASQNVAGLLLDFGGIDTGDTTDIATFSVLDSPPGPVEQGVSQLEEVFAANGGTSITTGERDLPLGKARTVSFDATAQGAQTRTDVYLVPSKERTFAVSTTYVKGRDTADVDAMLASLRPA